MGSWEPPPFLQVVSPWREAEKLCPPPNILSEEKSGAQTGFYKGQRSRPTGFAHEINTLSMQSSLLLDNFCWFPKGPSCLSATNKSILTDAIFHSAALPSTQPSNSHPPVGCAWHNPLRCISALGVERGHSSLSAFCTEASPQRQSAASGNVGHSSIKGTATFLGNALSTRP